MLKQRRYRRAAFTLVELLVVISIILVVAAAGYYLLPPLATNNNRVRALDQLQEMLLTARQRARRDQVGTGVRLIVNPNLTYSSPPSAVAGGTPQLVDQMAYVQQADPFTGGVVSTTASSSTVTFSGVDLLGPGNVGGVYTPQNGLVQPGDYFLDPAGTLHQIASITPPATPTGPTTVTLSSSVAGTATSASNYTIYRQPRLLQGEEIKQMTSDLVIDLSLDSTRNFLFSLNVPHYPIPGSSAPPPPPAPPPWTYEIMFAPNGSVMGQGTLGGKIVLWVLDNSAVAQPAPPTLIAVNGRTGFVGAYDVNTTIQTGSPAAVDWYLFTEDGRSGGM